MASRTPVVVSSLDAHRYREVGMSEPTFMKIKIIGTYWKLSFILDLAKFMGIEIQYYMCGSGRGDL